MDRSSCRFGLGRPFSARRCRGWFLALGFGVTSAMSIAPAQATLCGGVAYPFPYTDVSTVGAPFCPGIMEAYVTGVSKGTTPTTFSPNNTVTRVQMTTFLQRSLDQGLTRTSRRAALNQWWTPGTNAMQTISVGGFANVCAADGEDIWVSNFLGQVIQVQANTGTVLGTWTGATNDGGVVVAAGKVFVAGQTSPGELYVIDPTKPPGVVATAASNLGNNPISIAFDGTHLWTANLAGGSVSIITPQATTPYPVVTVATGFSGPFGILYDGAHIWVTDIGTGTLLKLDSAGAVLQTVTVGAVPYFPAFDGANIWVPNHTDNSITVVQASTGNVVATITADASNLLNTPNGASFDGERILVANHDGASVTLFKAADLSFIANVSTGVSTNPESACSDGINFWLPLQNTGNLLRF
jgi:DNA-binding beta-propeller fold protein YncE